MNDAQLNPSQIWNLIPGFSLEKIQYSTTPADADGGNIINFDPPSDDEIYFVHHIAAINPNRAQLIQFWLITPEGDAPLYSTTPQGLDRFAHFACTLAFRTPYFIRVSFFGCLKNDPLTAAVVGFRSRIA